MELNEDSNKLMEVVQSTPETALVPSPSRKRKGNGLSADGAALEELREGETADDVVGDELVGLGLPMFDSPADPIPTTKCADKLDQMDEGKSPQQLADEASEMALEEIDFTRYTRIWESQWGSNGCGSFADMTILSSMQLAHLVPGTGPSDPGGVGTALQVYSIKISEVKGGLQWPLRVYGVVAVRDTVDHNRNVLFARDSTAYQIVEEDDPFLCLIGPSRAIVLEDPVVFEIQLKLGVSPISRDRSLISGTRRYYLVGSGTISFENCFCTTELRVQTMEHSVQATILGIRVKDGIWPSLYGGIVYCLSPPLGETKQVVDQKLVLHDSRTRKMPQGIEGYLHLSRHVVSVEVESHLNFILQTYSSPSGDIGEFSTVCFEPRYSNISQQTCCLGGTEVEITVAWSRLVADKRDIALNGWVEMCTDE